jgi:hypothetical protein
VHYNRQLEALTTNGETGIAKKPHKRFQTKKSGDGDDGDENNVNRKSKKGRFTPSSNFPGPF